MKIIVVLLCVLYRIQPIFTIFEFPKDNLHHVEIPLTEEQLLQAIQLGTESIQQRKRLEGNLIRYNIHVTNGSISHAQFLETFPNEEAKRDDYVARKILRSTLYLNTQCKLLNINTCADYFSAIPLPNSKLRDECLDITRTPRDGHYAFRRLLPAHYKDGFYQMYKDPDVPKPRVASKLAMTDRNNVKRFGNNVDVEDERNLVLVQWAQFIEHDLSKSAVTIMADGTPIECCNADFLKLKPRYVHPLCAPLEGVSGNIYAQVSCLNYVRSALAVDRECEFGPAQLLNQATSSLDLSQLYGNTNELKSEMRIFVGGQLKTSEGDLLPLAESKGQFCAFSTNSNKLCFMAGDNRVNSNPFMNFIYTIFLRSHNKIAQALQNKYPVWNDEQLYNSAKKANIEIYRNIIYNEWLPLVLGEDLSNAINRENDENKINDKDKGVSNEFAVAAIRFYYSMMPDSLLGSPPIYQTHLQENIIDSQSRITPERLFSLKDEFYTSNFLLNLNKLEIALEAMIEQRAMKMDAQYADSVMKYFLQTDLHSDSDIGSDALAWDIQRGRDHGLAPYIKYLQICTRKIINEWSDLSGIIHDENIEELKKVYNELEDVDLIIGSLFEIPRNGSMLGPTFTCILGEQFSKFKIFDTVNLNQNNIKAAKSILSWSNDYSGTKLLCDTTSLEAVPKNIFLAPSEKNTMVSCSNF